MCISVSVSVSVYAKNILVLYACSHVPGAVSLPLEAGCAQENFFNISTSETSCFWWLLSKHLGKSLSAISTGPGPLHFNSQILGVSPTTHGAKLRLIYGLTISKIAALDTFTI